MNNINFTASPMTKPADMPLKASLAWDYFFGNGCWFCVETGDGGIIVTDESRDLSNAFVLPDYASFLEWLESDATDKLAEDPAEYFRACGVVPDDLLSDSVVQALLATINSPGNSPDNPTVSPVSAEEKPGPTAAVPEPELQEYYVTFSVRGKYVICVDAADLDSAKKTAQAILDTEETDFNDMEYEGAEIVFVEDNPGNVIYDTRKIK